MSDSDNTDNRGIAWVDLTVENAEDIRDFYKEVTGWSASSVSMGEYNDFNMEDPDTGEPVAGICHARGSNAELPPAWMVYIPVTDINKSISVCLERGGEVIKGPIDAGDYGTYCVIRDPAGAVCALIGN